MTHSWKPTLRMSSELTRKTTWQLWRNSKPSVIHIHSRHLYKQNVLAAEKIKPVANSDTFWSSGTLRAASRAAGAAVEAVKRVAEGRNRHVFCCVRPPGHHAGLEGATENAVSSGFSIVNNAMIGTFTFFIFSLFCSFICFRFFGSHRKRSNCPSLLTK